MTDGYTGSAKVVASAAIIMISVFASFIFSPDPTTKSLGFALALGVLIDAFVIRMTVVPATMFVYGGSAWWLPRWLGRILPDLDIEGRNLSVPTGSTPNHPNTKLSDLRTHTERERVPSFGEVAALSTSRLHCEIVII